MLAGLDAVVVDLQDVGVRFYTYATTMAYLMEAAAKRRLKVFILDRPNPIGAAGVRGPMLDPDLRSFTGYFPMPLQHGHDAGRTGDMFNGENENRRRPCCGRDARLPPRLLVRRDGAAVGQSVSQSPLG